MIIDPKEVFSKTAQLVHAKEASAIVTLHQTCDYVSSLNFSGEGALARYKLRYRPYICPFDAMLNLIPMGKSVLDIGCGEGIFLLMASKFVNPARVAGIDTSARALALAKRRLEHTGTQSRVEHYDGTSLPTWARDYDFFTMIDVLHHIPFENQRTFFYSVVDAMRPGSHFLIKDICRGKLPWVYFNKLHDLVIAKELGQERTQAEVESWVAKNESSVMLVSKGYKRTLVYPHFWLLLQKK